MGTKTKVDLEQYKTGPAKVDPQELERLDDKLEELANTALRFEELPRELMLFQKALYTYHQLSTEFLSLSNEKEWKGESIKVPRFSVYRLDDHVMEMNFGRRRDGIGLYRTTSYTAKIDRPRFLPEIIEMPLLRSLEVFSKDYSKDHQGEYSFYHLPKEVRKKYRRVGAVEISSTFHGLIPLEVKDKIEEAKKTFFNEIFFLVETQPEEWNIRRFVSDPLIAGVHKNTCFYIGEFKTTPLEEYVRREFIE